MTGKFLMVRSLWDRESDLDHLGPCTKESGMVCMPYGDLNPVLMGYLQVCVKYQRGIGFLVPCASLDSARPR